MSLFCVSELESLICFLIRLWHMALCKCVFENLVEICDNKWNVWYSWFRFSKSGPRKLLHLHNHFIAARKSREEGVNKIIYTVHFCASAQHSVAWRILFVSCLSVVVSVHPCVHPKTLLTWYRAEYLTHFHQTYASSVLWDRDECVTFWGEKVEGQGHYRIHYAGFHCISQCPRSVLLFACCVWF